jgi:7-cyano-7-deazaguanine synthase
MKKQAVLSLSGGMDSSTLLLHLLANGYEVTALSFDYGQKHNVELERAKDLVKYINTNPNREWYNSDFEQMIINYPIVKHQVIKLDGLSQLLNSALVTGGEEVPEGHYENENMKATVVPNRNMIFSSIVQAVALSIATKNNTECVIALGLHSGDHAVYPDTTEQFRQSCLETFKIGNWDSHLVDYYTPYMETNKFGILEDGNSCVECLGLDFNEVYKRTNTSYKPIYIPYPESTSRVEEVHRTKFGEWYSDYKSASSVERVEAFMKLGRPDPVEYADETGPVSWETVVEHVKTILNNHNNANI